MANISWNKNGYKLLNLEHVTWNDIFWPYSVTHVELQLEEVAEMRYIWRGRSHRLKKPRISDVPNLPSTTRPICQVMIIDDWWWWWPAKLNTIFDEHRCKVGLSKISTKCASLKQHWSWNVWAIVIMWLTNP